MAFSPLGHTPGPSWPPLAPGTSANSATPRLSQIRAAAPATLPPAPGMGSKPEVDPMNRTITALALIGAIVYGAPARAKPDEMPQVTVAKDKKGFVLDPSARSFVPWGFNYDHDARGRLIEDYWDD